MKRYFCRLSYLWILFAMPLSASTVRIYVVNDAGTTIDVVDPATNKVVQVIKDIEAPLAADFAPDGSRVYITHGFESVLEVVDRKSGKHIKEVPLSGHADHLAVTKDGRRVLVCINPFDPYAVTGNAPTGPPGAIDIIDTTSLEKVKSIPVKRGLHDMALTQDGKYAVFGSPLGHFLTVLDLRSEQIAWELPLDKGVQPLAIESNPDGSARRVFLQLRNTYEFAVVDFAMRKEVARIKLPDEPGGFYSEGNSSHGIGVAPDNRTLWVNSRPANAVFVYSLPEIKLLGHVSFDTINLPGHPPIEGQPQWITFTPDSKTVYVSNANMKSVSAIDVKTMKEVARIPVGERPDRLSTLVLP